MFPRKMVLLAPEEVGAEMLWGEMSVLPVRVFVSNQ